MDNTTIESLKELILTKFLELEKRLDIKFDNIDERLTKAEKDITTLQVSENNKSINSLQEIKSSFFKWLVPFAMMLLLLWAKTGFKTL